MGTHLQRTFAVIDIENLCGGPDNVDHLQRYIRYLYDQLSDGSWMPIIASSSHTVRRCPNMWWTWPDARRLHRTGCDAADTALLDALSEPTAARSSHVEIWSGDHIFTKAVRELTRSGVDVTVRAAPGTLSRQLRHVSTRAHELVELTFVTEAIDWRPAA